MLNELYDYLENYELILFHSLTLSILTNDQYLVYHVKWPFPNQLHSHKKKLSPFLYLLSLQVQLHPPTPTFAPTKRTPLGMF